MEDLIMYSKGYRLIRDPINRGMPGIFHCRENRGNDYQSERYCDIVKYDFGYKIDPVWEAGNKNIRESISNLRTLVNPRSTPSLYSYHSPPLHINNTPPLPLFNSKKKPPLSLNILPTPPLPYHIPPTNSLNYLFSYNFPPNHINITPPHTPQRNK